jgi:4-amino-4-deoxy-L-arabinose transferase-like glycosyltransferase
MSLATRPPLALIFAVVALFLWQLGAAPLFDVDEGAFAQASREMLNSGDWGHTTLNGADRFDKPILIYWFQAALMGLIGPYDWVARLPSALAVLAALFMVHRFCAHQFDQQVANRAMLMLASSLGLLSIGRAATADGLLNALIIATTLSLWLFAANGQRSHLRWAYAWCALGILAKGPIAVLVPGGALLVWSLFSDRGRTAWRAIFCPSGWVILLLIAAPWYLYALDRHGMAFIEGFILKHNVERFTGTLEGHGGSFLYYLVFLPLLLLPWSGLGIRMLASVKKLWTQALPKFFLLWAAFVFVFFSLSGTKLPHYMLYGLTPLVILIAVNTTQYPLSRIVSVLVWLSLALGWLTALGLPALVAYGAITISDPWYQGLLSTAPSAHLVWAFSSLCGFAWLILWRVKYWPEWDRLFAAGWLASMLWVAVCIPWLAQTLQSPFKEAAQWMQANHPNQQVVQWRLHQPSFAFYLGRPTPQIEPGPHDWLIARADRLDNLSGQYTTIYQNRGLVLLKPFTTD